MHELSVAQSVLDIARKEMQKANSSVIRELELEIGTLSGIEIESLQFALRALTAGSEWEAMQIVIQRPEGLAHCNECISNFSLNSFVAQCPQCKGYNCNIIQGRE